MWEQIILKLKSEFLEWKLKIKVMRFKSQFVNVIILRFNPKNSEIKKSAWIPGIKAEFRDSKVIILR